MVRLRENFYIFAGGTVVNQWDHVYEVEMYSLLTKTCKVVANVEDALDQQQFCAYAVCGFTDKIYLLGGLDEVEEDHCIEFDTKDCSWKNKSPMHEVRENPSACVFEERIIVSGGMQYEEEDFDWVNLNDEENHRAVNTAEAYDPIQDDWKRLPNMNLTRCRHGMVAVHQKMFVIGGGTEVNEVFDSTSERFTVLKQPLNFLGSGGYSVLNVFASFSIGSKLFAYFYGSPNVFIYDVIKKEWVEQALELMKNLTKFSAVAAPQL